MTFLLLSMFPRVIHKTESRHVAHSTSSSNPRRTFGWRTKTWTSDPSPAKIPANSNAIYPPPTMQILLGLSGRFKASSEVMTCSLPGILGTVARPPTEIRMCLAAYFLPFTSIVCASITCIRITSKLSQVVCHLALSQAPPTNNIQEVIVVHEGHEV